MLTKQAQGVAIIRLFIKNKIIIMVRVKEVLQVLSLKITVLF